MARPTERQIDDATAVAQEFNLTAVGYDGSWACGGCSHRADEHTWGRERNPCERDGCDCTAWEPGLTDA